MSRTPTAILGTDRVVSDSGLLAVLRKDSRAWMAEDATTRPGVLLDPAFVRDELPLRWREGVRRQVKQLTKRSRGMLEMLSGDALYSDLDDPLSRRAALVAELFRDHGMTKNAGRLDVRALQQLLLHPLRTGTPLHLEIAWGQPKRGAGGLKTAGQMADLADAYATARLVALAESAAELAKNADVRLTVLSGGDRFAEALLTRPWLREVYDRQRQRIADSVSGRASVLFRDYKQAQLDKGADGGAWRDRYEQQLAVLSNEAVASRLRTVLLNIDWDNVLSHALSGERPHGVGLTRNVAEWVAAEATGERVGLLTKMAISSVVNPRHQAAWHELIGHEDVLEDGIAFFSAVAWEATRRYVAIHAADRQTDEAKPDGSVIRLTVHEKRDRPDIPAILTLGVWGGDLLSQHVTALVHHREPVTFQTVAEITAGSPDAVPVRVGGSAAGGSDPDGGLFDWLASSDQPLCFAHGGQAEIHNAVSTVLDPNQG